MMSKTSVVIADDHPLLRRGLGGVISEEGTFDVVAEASNGEMAVELIGKHKPEIAVLDINMPKLDGLAVLRAMQAQGSQTSVIFITVHGGEDLFRQAFALGAKGYIMKDTSLLDIVDGLRAVRNGQYFAPPALMKLLLGATGQGNGISSNEQSRLTPSERKILQLIGAGKSSKEIAQELFIHHKTVENHRTNISQKLGVSGPHALLRFALQKRTKF